MEKFSVNAISDRIKAVRAHFDMSGPAFSDFIGLPLPSLRNYEQGKQNPGTEAIQAFISIGVRSDWLLTGQGPMLSENTLSSEQRSVSLNAVDYADTTYRQWSSTVSAEDFVPLRYYGNVAISAGSGKINYMDYQPQALYFSESFIRDLGARPSDLLLVNVAGDSMAPTLQPGSTIMLDTSAKHAGPGIYVLRIGEQELCKRLEPMPRGKIRVVSDNPSYATYEIDLAATPEGDFVILGRVVWSATVIR